MRNHGRMHKNKHKNIENIENANNGAYERSDMGFGNIRYKDQIAPELADINKSPSEIANAIRRDKDTDRTNKLHFPFRSPVHHFR